MAVLFSWAGAGLSSAPFDFTTSVGTGDTAFSGVYGTSSKLQVVADGSRPARFAVDDTVANPAGAYWTNATDRTNYAVRFYFEYGGYSASASGTVAAGLRSGGSLISWRFDVSPTGDIRFRGDGAAAVWSPTNNLTRGTVYRIEIVATGASAAVYIYAGDSATALYTSGAQAIGSGLGTLRIGENSSSNMSGKKYDDIIVSDTAALIGPAAVMTTISAGDDQVAVEPFSAVVLTGAVVTGSVASWSWTQLSGPAVTLGGSGASRTFSAPVATVASTLVFQVTGGGAQDQVSVQVLPHLDWLRTASGVVPLRPGTL